MKTTRIIAALAALTMACPMMPMCFLQETVITAGAAEYGQLTYTVQEDGTIVITACAKDAVTVEIPAEIEGKKVTGIGLFAFENCTSLTKVTIPDSMQTIGYAAFKGCSHLTGIAIPNSVTSIGYGAFGLCSSLREITIPDSVTNIGDNAFQSCISLASVTIPDSVTSIGYEAFSACTALTAVTIPGSVTSIGTGAFGGCSSLTKITIPDSVTSIGKNAFLSCTGLSKITVPDSVTSIGYNAFYNTAWYNAQPDGLVYSGNWLCGYKGDMPEGAVPVLRDGTVRIAGGVFSGRTALRGITIPDSVISIGEYAFDGCTGLREITIPDSAASIGDGAFSGCTALTNVTVPDSVTSIGDGAFSSCSGLTNITILNPECKIANYSHTISNGYISEDGKYIYTGAITGYEDSTAQEYAGKYGCTFVSLGEAPVPGDVNGDGDVNAVDASLLLAAAALAGQGQPTGLTPEQETAADVDGKNGFNAVDASYILQYAAFVGNNPGVNMDIKDFIIGR